MSDRKTHTPNTFDAGGLPWRYTYKFILSVFRSRGFLGNVEVKTHSQKDTLEAFHIPKPAGPLLFKHPARWRRGSSYQINLSDKKHGSLGILVSSSARATCCRHNQFINNPKCVVRFAFPLTRQILFDIPDAYTLPKEYD